MLSMRSAGFILRACRSTLHQQACRGPRAQVAGMLRPDHQRMQKHTKFSRPAVCSSGGWVQQAQPGL